MTKGPTAIVGTFRSEIFERKKGGQCAFGCYSINTSYTIIANIKWLVNTDKNNTFYIKVTVYFATITLVKCTWNIYIVYLFFCCFAVIIMQALIMLPRTYRHCNETFYFSINILLLLSKSWFIRLVFMGVLCLSVGINRSSFIHYHFTKINWERERESISNLISQYLCCYYWYAQPL